MQVAVVAVAPILFPFFISVSLYDSGKTTDRIHHVIQSISRGMGIVLFLLYLVWIYFRRKTHVVFFTDAEDKERKVIKVRDTPFYLFTILSIPAVPYVRADGGQNFEPLHSKSSRPALTMTGSTAAVPTNIHRSRAIQIMYGFLGAASFVTSVFLSRFVVASLPTLARSSSVSTNFLTVIIVPLTVNCSNYIKSVESARRHVNISLSVHITFGAAVGNVLFTLPVLMLVGWSDGPSVLLDFPGVHLAVLLGSVWVTSFVMRSGNLYFIHGLACLSL